MKQTDRPKRKVNAPKRFICENDKNKNKNTIINKLTCYRCKVDITLNKIKYFEHNNNIYCNLCYIDIINIPNNIPNIIPNNIPKLNIIIMNKSKSNPNLIDINNKTNKTNNVKTPVNNISIKKNDDDDNNNNDEDENDDEDSDDKDYEESEDSDDKDYEEVKKSEESERV